MVTAQDRGFLVSIVLNGAIMLVAYTLFIIFRNRYKKIYEPRTFLINRNPAPAKNGVFGWLKSTLTYTDEEMYNTCGIDALIYTRLMKLIFMIILFQALYCWTVLFPVHITGPNRYLPVDDPLFVGGLAVSSMSNIPSKSLRFWAHIVNILYITIVTLVLLYRESKVYIEYRMRHKMERAYIENYTTMVMDLPEGLRKEGTLFNWFRSNYAYWNVLDVKNTYYVPKLRELHFERIEKVRDLERAQHYLNTKDERDTTKTGCCGCVGEKVDTIDYNRDELNKIDNKIAEKNKNLNEGHLNHLSFVTFDSIQTQNICSNIIIDSVMDRTHTQQAPEPRAVKWRNAHITRRQFFFRSIAIGVATFFLIFFWMIPVAFVSSLTSLTYLSSISWLSWLNSFFDAIGPVVRGWFEGYLPLIILAVFMSVLLPLIVRRMTVAQGYVDKAKIEISFFNKMYLFNVMNTFLGVTIAGAIFTIIDNVISQPSSVFPLLSKSIPKQAFFFTNYVMLLGFVIYPLMELFRVIDFLVYFAKRRFLAKSMRELHEARTFAPMNYGLRYSQDLLVFLVTLTFSAMYPFILIFSIIYYINGYIALKHNLCYVRPEQFRMGGLFFPSVAKKILYSLIFFQVCMAAILLSYEFYYMPFIAIPVLLTIAFTIWMSSNYRKVERFCTYNLLGNVVHRELKNVNNRQVEQINKREIEESTSGNLDLDFYYKDAYLQPIQKNPDALFPVGEFGEFNYQRNKVNRDIEEPL